MKSTKVLLLFFLVANCTNTKTASNKNTIEPLFRYAHININDSLILGKNMNHLLVYGSSEYKNSYRVPISYHGTESITSIFGDDSIITDLVFTYQPLFDFKGQLSSYSDDFGAPTIIASENHQVYRWTDKITVFDLVETFKGNDTLFYSILSDKRSSLFKDRSYTSLKKLRVSPNMHDVLSKTELWSIIGNLNEEIKSEIREEILALDSTQIFALVDKNFNSPRLYELALTYMSEKISNESLLELNTWLFSDWSINQDYIIKSYEPPNSLEEYVQSLETQTPPQERIVTMYGFVQANKAGEFFLKINEAKNALISEIISIVNNSTNEYAPLSEQEQMNFIEQYNLGVLVSFLWAMEPLTNQQILQSTNSYNSPSGRLFVNTYSNSVEFLFNHSGENLIQDLKKIE